MQKTLLNSRFLKLSAVVLTVAFALLFSMSQSAYAGTAIGSTITMPTTVVVGDTNVAASMLFVNNSTPNDDNHTVTISNIELNTTAANDGVFAISGTGTQEAGTSCGAVNFTITPDGAGSWNVTPNVVLPKAKDNGTCQINFTFDVLEAPGDDDNDFIDGNQVFLQVSGNAVNNQFGTPGNAAGTGQTTVIVPLEVEKTVDTSYDRSWDWTIEKSADQTDLTLADGEVPYVVNYTVSVDAVPTDQNHYVEGTITITNPVGNADATIMQESDIVDQLDTGEVMDIDCETIGWPVVLGGGDSLSCSYGGYDVDGDATENTVTVTTTGEVPGNSDTADVEYGDPTTEIDECINVSDDSAFSNVTGQVCADDADEDKVFEYEISFGAHEEADVILECGETEYPNIASFTVVDDENDTGQTGQADETVVVNVDCFQGCTLTQGYWKTHNESFKGGAPTDDNWDTITPDGEESPFYLSGKSWFEAFWTPPAGNAYYNLAHQFMAAVLNVNNGASVPADVQSALDDATNFFENNGPDAVGKGKNANKQLQKQLTSWAGIFGSFNEGKTGPGHCDEQF